MKVRYNLFSMSAIVVLLLSSGCWKTQDQFEQYGDETDDGGVDTGEASCDPMMPCTSSTTSGYTCPGSSATCWDLSDHCDGSYLCTTQESACIIACGDQNCGPSDDEVPEPVCY